jgi:hypothetical protein
MRHDRQEAEKALRHARSALDYLRRFVVAYTVTDALPDAKVEAECRLCAQAGHSAAVYALERCRWCWDFAREHGEDPAPALVRMHCDGRVIGPSMIARFHRRRVST